MANSYFLIFICIFLLFQLVKCEFPLVPALYVLGDSLVDSGNNNFLPTQGKGNYPPYGIDFPSMQATGRFTNGKTSVDFLAQLLGLPLVPPYLGLSPEEKRKITTGVNYASGGAGILPESGTAQGKLSSLNDQLDNFQRTLTQDLPNNFKTHSKLYSYLAKSIFVISIGSNDFMNNYLQPAKYNTSQRYNPEQFTIYLIDSLKQRLTRLYMLGARKIVLYGLSPIGCVPAVKNSVNPKSTTCIESVNDLILMYNAKVPSLLSNLTHTLPLSTFVLHDDYDASYELCKDPAAFGYTAGQAPCCTTGGNISDTLCKPNIPPCSDRTKHLYWDSCHPTETNHQRTANSVFNGSLCTPFNIQHLAMQ